MATSLSATITRRACKACRLMAGLTVSWGVGAAHGGPWIIVPEITASETYSTNLGTTATSSQSGWITNIAPGIRVDGAGARITAFLDYRLDNLYYHNRSDLNQHRNTLTSFANVQAVENFLFVDASANIAQYRRSVFGPTAVDQNTATGNQIETRTFQVSPYVRGRIPSAADYLVRLTSIDSRSDDPALASTRVNRLLATIKNQATAGTIGWFVDGNTTAVHNDVIGDRDNTRVRGGVIFPVFSEVHVSVSTGQERTNYGSTDAETTATPGVGIEWAPSQHTQLAALREKRFFGAGHNVLLTHRTPLTAWRYSDVKDAAVLPIALAGYNPGSIQELMSDLLTSSIPDPVVRAQTVRSRMSQFNPVASLADGGGVQTSQIYVERLQQASVALLGIRNTFTLLLTQREQRPLSAVPGVADEFGRSSELRERAASLSWLRRLTPLANLSLSAARLRYKGLGVPNLESTQTTGTFMLAYRLAPKTSASLGARRTRFNSTDFGLSHEDAFVASVTQRF